MSETKFIRMCPKVLHIPWLRDLHNNSQYIDIPIPYSLGCVVVMCMWYGRSVRRHIEDGVCLPAMDKFLSRHVSRRSI